MGRGSGFPGCTTLFPDIFKLVIFFSNRTLLSFKLVMWSTHGTHGTLIKATITELSQKKIRFQAKSLCGYL
jgi:hypothetical protein